MAETPLPQVEVAEGGKLRLNRDAQTAFRVKAAEVDRLLQLINDRVADTNTANYFAKSRGKLSTENAQAVRQHLAERLSAVVASLPDRLGKHAKENGAIKAILERDETDKVIQELKNLICEELNQFIEQAIQHPDDVPRLVDDLRHGVRESVIGVHQRIAYELSRR